MKAGFSGQTCGTTAFLGEQLLTCLLTLNKQQAQPLLFFDGRGIMESKERIENPLMAQANTGGKDEMNLAEFPLCVLSHRPSLDIKTLKFEDQIWDGSQKKWIPRKVTVTGSDAFGLPTQVDDEVLLALVQISKRQDFADRKVSFTRHELIRLLNWTDDGKSYRRLETSLNRWSGVTLYYDNAWWSRERQCWVDANFHVLDNVWLCHRGKSTPDTGLPEVGAPQSAFVWNEMMFASFRAGNLKSLDFDFYTSLRSAVSKRLYRFLDKRFHFGHECNFDLRELCWEHVGLSRKSDTANLKRKLLVGIAELEERGFLQPMNREEQFQKLRAGKWTVKFLRASKPTVVRKTSAKKSSDAILNALVERGIAFNTAQDLVRGYDAGHIQQQMEYFDWQMKRPDKRIVNPGGFLTSAIQSSYEIPGEFLRNRNSPTLKPSIPPTPKYGVKTLRETEQEQKASAFWKSLSSIERQRLEEDALAQANPVQRQWLEGGGRLASTTKHLLIQTFALKMSQIPSAR
jgi:hypothetical protein